MMVTSLPKRQCVNVISAASILIFINNSSSEIRTATLLLPEYVRASIIQRSVAEWTTPDVGDI